MAIIPPRPLELRTRRWTLVFSVPITDFMAIVGAYSVFLMFTGDRLEMMIGGCSAFVALCVGGTLGKSVLDAWCITGPAVVVDQHGLHDLRSETGLIPWREIERLKLDPDEQRILVNVTKGTAGRHGSTARRLLAGGDYVVALGGLSYSHRELSNALAEYHRQGRGASAGAAETSDA